MKKTVLVTVLAALLLVLLTACTHDGPPDSSLPEPDPHDGVFTSAYGTMTFNGDGESIVFDFSPELAEAAELPTGEQSGSYVFLFRHGKWRYDKAESFRITVSDASYDFINDFTVTDENTIALVSPIEGKDNILFIKKGES